MYEKSSQFHICSVHLLLLANQSGKNRPIRSISTNPDGSFHLGQICPVIKTNFDIFTGQTSYKKRMPHSYFFQLSDTGRLKQKTNIRWALICHLTDALSITGLAPFQPPVTSLFIQLVASLYSRES